MKGFCRFARLPSATAPCCTAGVNFGSVGDGRALCHLCPLADLGQIPLCPYVDVHTWLRNGLFDAIIEVELTCRADAEVLTQLRCQDCAVRPSLVLKGP